MNLVPNKLATTYGVELTFVPDFLDDLNNAAKEYNADASLELDLRPFAFTLRNILHSKKVQVYSCGTDPGCVEVPTMPFNNMRKLRENIRTITRYAKSIMLTPRPQFTIGGGAHIHAGIPFSRYDTEYDLFVTEMQLWAAKNPWITFAFAGCNDYYNALPLTRDCLITGDLQDLIEEFRYAQRNVRDYRALVVEYENVLHTPDNWGSSFPHTNFARMISEYRESMNRYKLRAARYAKKIRAMEGKDSTFVHNSNIRKYNSKDRNIVARGDTMEWRCFIMPQHATGHEKHIAIVDRIVRKCAQEASVMAETGICEHDMRGVYTQEEVNKMTLRQAQVGLNKMLDSLGLDRDNYKEYYRNMTLRFWLMRKERRH